MKKINLIIFLVFITIFLFNCEPEWKATVNAYEEKLAALEELSEKVMTADKEAIESAKVILEEMTALEEANEDMPEEAMEEIMALSTTYAKAIEVLMNITIYEASYKDMAAALEESKVLLAQAEEQLPQIIELYKVVLTGSHEAAQMFQAQAPALIAMEAALTSIAARLSPEEALSFQNSINELFAKYPEIEELKAMLGN